MSIVVAYVPRPEGEAALVKGIELARASGEPLVVVNASPGGHHDDSSMIDGFALEALELRLANEKINAQVKQFVRGHSAVEEILELIEGLQASMLIIGMRKRSAVGKMLLGSVAQELLLQAPCPVLSVKAAG